MTESRRVAIARCAMAVVLLLASVTLLAVRDGRGQEAGRVYRIAFLSIRDSSESTEPSFGAFVQALRELGWVEGRNIAIEYHWGDGNADRLLALAVDLARRKPDVIFTTGTPATAAAKKATATVPIVMWTTLDPVRQGFIVSMARPGGNVTGLSDFTTLSRKQLELTKELLPGASRVAVLRNPAGLQAVYHTSEVEQAARALGLQLQIVDVRSPHELAGALAAATQNRPHVMVMLADPMFLSECARLAELALKHRLPSIYVRREFVAAGGLLAYGSSRIEVSRRQAAYVDKILKGAKPADLPIEQPTKFELVINLKTAKALGLTIPPSLLLRADQVIE
jgi:putative tryptophan/tyrosine transport system substrate-binding protein